MLSWLNNLICQRPTSGSKALQQSTAEAEYFKHTVLRALCQHQMKLGL